MPKQKLQRYDTRFHDLKGWVDGRNGITRYQAGRVRPGEEARVAAYLHKRGDPK